MKIRCWSDLHIDGAALAFGQDCPDEVLVLAGDTANSLVRCVNACIELSPKFKAIIVIAGNHEYYKGDIWATFAKDFRWLVRDFHNIHFLDTKNLMIEDVTFIGATLWSNFDNSNSYCLAESSRCINDFRFMRIGDHQGVKPSWMQKEHQYDLNFIREACKSIKGKKVVVTHFPPLRDFQHPRWGSIKENPLNGYFMSDLEHEIEDLEFNLWICGHTHDGSDFEKWGKRFVCNPRGYAYRGKPENEQWDINKVVEV